MHPPSAVCSQLHRKHRDLRLAWHGPMECFAVVRLMPNTALGSADDPMTFNEPWYTTAKLDAFGKAYIARDTKGPIFARDGRPRRDWDPLFYTPVIVALCNEQFGTTSYDVFSGRIVQMSNIVPHREAWRDRYKRAQERGRDTERAVQDGHGQALDEVWTAATRGTDSYHSVSNIARKHITASAKQRAWEDGLMGFEDRYVNKQALTPDGPKTES
jgi:hypothetical protein